MKKGMEYTGKVVDLSFPNKGKIDCGEEGIAIVKGTIPGQTVKFVVSKKRTGKAIGRLKEVVEKSELENVEPKCPHFGMCGGCSYQTMDYDNQLSLKEKTVKDILDNDVKQDYKFEGIIGSPVNWEYRNKMEFSFGDEVKDGPLTLGMHKKNSFHDIVTVNQCQIIHSDYRKVLDCVLDFCKRKQLPFYKKMKHIGYLRHLLVRRTSITNQMLVAVVTTSEKQWEDQTNWQELVEELKGLDLDAKLCGVIHIINDGLADVVQSDETRILYGDEYIYEELLGLRFKISVFSFFQTNSLGAEVLYSKAREYIGDTKDMTVFDLYSGTGTIAQIIAPVAKKVVGVEIVEEAVEAAKVNAGLNGLDNCEFIAGDVLKVIDEIQDKPDMIVLDPPRDGINPKALQKIIDFGVNNLVYISCKPTSLARDLEMLQEQGYKVEKACAVDMFPNTVHVETVALLSKLSDAKDNIEVTVDMDEIDVTSAESKATYEEIKNYVFKTYGLKVSNLYISQIKRKCGIEVGKTYNLPKSEGSRQPQCPIEKEKAIRDALKHFGRFKI